MGRLGREKRLKYENLKITVISLTSQADNQALLERESGDAKMINSLVFHLYPGGGWVLFLQLMGGMGFPMTYTFSVQLLPKLYALSRIFSLKSGGKTIWGEEEGGSAYG